MDEGEDPSVTAAIVNVVCELGWRRPQDFLPLAPRLFELLVDSGNNWMAIKLIKLVSKPSVGLGCVLMESSSQPSLH
jgi:AP-3 complex subunit delta